MSVVFFPGERERPVAMRKSMTQEPFAMPNNRVTNPNFSVTNPNISPFDGANENDRIKAEMQHRVRLAALPAEPGESAKSAQRRAARRLGLGYGLLRRLWYGLVQRVDAATADHIRKGTEHLEQLQVRVIDLERELAAACRRADPASEPMGRQPGDGPGQLDD